MNRNPKCPQVHARPMALVALAASIIFPIARAEAAVDACTLLTRSQVSAALGIAVDAGTRPISDEPGMCNWHESHKPTGPGRNVMLTLISEKEFERLETQPGAKPVAGIGDAAIVTHSIHVPALLTVRAGAYFFQILARSDVVESEDVDARNQAIERTLAAKITKKLA